MVPCAHHTVSEASAVCESLPWGSASLGSWHLSRSPAASPPRSQHLTGAGSALRDVTGNVAVNLHSSQIKVYPSTLRLKLVKRRAEVYRALLLAKSTRNKTLLPENPPGLSAAAPRALPSLQNPCTQGACFVSPFSAEQLSWNHCRNFCGYRLHSSGYGILPKCLQFTHSHLIPPHTCFFSFFQG